jgi:ABC-type antimicrobial peptide transport system ATPase subunit
MRVNDVRMVFDDPCMKPNPTARIGEAFSHFEAME